MYKIIPRHCYDKNFVDNTLASELLENSLFLNLKQSYRANVQ